MVASAPERKPHDRTPTHRPTQKEPHMSNTVQGIVSTRDERRPPSVFDTIQALQPEIARALPKGMDADRVALVMDTEQLARLVWLRRDLDAWFERVAAATPRRLRVVNGG